MHLRKKLKILGLVASSSRFTQNLPEPGSIFPQKYSLVHNLLFFPLLITPLSIIPISQSVLQLYNFQDCQEKLKKKDLKIDDISLDFWDKRMVELMFHNKYIHAIWFHREPRIGNDFQVDTPILITHHPYIRPNTHVACNKMCEWKLNKTPRSTLSKED